MGASTTENSAGSLKRTYAKGERHPQDANREWDGKQWVLVNKSPSSSHAVEAKNLAKPPSADALKDNPNDSDMVRAAKRRQRAQREAMKMKGEED